VNQEFKKSHPEVKLGLRKFESEKPYFVQPVRQKDRETSCCRQHTEIRMVFKRCMEFRRQLLKTQNVDVLARNRDCEHLTVYETLTDLVNATLCETSEGHKLTCVNRQCSLCGVRRLTFHENEMDENENTDKIQWEKYSYVPQKGKGEEIIRKLQIVKCQTSPGQLFKYLIELLEQFPAHQFRAIWQNDAYKDIRTNLPANHAVCVHDFSENYRCTEKTEIQSSYFKRNEVSIHVSIIHRHRTADDDSPDEIVSEQFFVISNDHKHDRYFTAYVQESIAAYLKSLDLDIKVMHEFCDGCSSQYKSRNCMGDVCHACTGLGYDALIRNYHETSHAKGPQDAAGGIQKRQADIAVLRGKTTIQNAEDFFNFAKENLETPKSGIYSKRTFKYVDEIPRNGFQERDYKPVKENRKIHQIVATKSNTAVLLVRDISCYKCVQCVEGRTDACELTGEIGPPKLQSMITSSYVRSVDTMKENDVVAVFTDDPSCDFYLLKVKRGPTVLETEKSDNWGNTFDAGADVVEGLYYDRNGITSFAYKLVPGKIAIVYSCAVRFVCFGIKASNKICLDEAMHRSIVEAINA